MAEIKDFIYILSDQFDYSKVISPEASYGYAKNMGLQYDTLKNIDKHKNKYIILDNRITDRDCAIVEQKINGNPSFKLIMKITDPYYHHRKVPYYQLLFRLTKNSSVQYISPYHFSGLTKEIHHIVGDKRIFVCPYPFNPEKCVGNNFSERLTKIILSGARFKKIYPLRYRLIRNKYRFFSAALQRYTQVLRHPGYEEKSGHTIIGQKYIEYLSHFKFMLVTPSTHDLEFLKYNECAYAGCVPVGIPANSLPDEAKKNFIPLDMTKNIPKQLRDIIKSKENFEEMAINYRTSMKKARSTEQLYKKLFDFIDQ